MQKRLEVDVEFACTVIPACAILHNICEISRERYDDRWNFERADETGVLFHDGNDAKTGKTIRDDIASAFENHMLLNDKQMKLDNKYFVSPMIA